MLTRRQTRKVETEPMESDYWQSKTEALDAEYWEPFWAARIVFIGGVVFLAAVTISIILVPLIWPREWYNMVGGLFGAGLLLVSLLRQKKRMRLLRDADLQGRIRKFRALRKKEWNLALAELLADSSVKFIDEHGMGVAEPRAGAASPSVLLAKEGDLLAEIHNDKGRVGSIRLALVTSEQIV